MLVLFTGGCAYGAIRSACSAEPLRSVNCHCRDCQPASGGGHFLEQLEVAETIRSIRARLHLDDPEE